MMMHLSKTPKISSWDDRLDHFYLRRLPTYSGDLTKVVKIVLLLSHGNAEIERGFSTNKLVLEENLAEESLIAVRT